MNKSLQSKSKKDGSALGLVLVSLAILLVMGAGLLNLGQHCRIFASRTSMEIAARSAADAGLTSAVWGLNRMLETGHSFYQYSPPTGSDGIVVHATTQTLPNCDASFSFTVTKDSNSNYTVESVGKAGRAEKKVDCSLKLEGLFEYAVFAATKLDLKNGTTIDWYNYDADDGIMQLGTNSTAEASLIMKAGVTIEGDVLVGPGGDPDLVINSKTEATITGSTFPMIEERELPSITVPPNLNPALFPTTPSITGSTTITASRVLDSINIGNGDIIEINGPIVLYVIGDVILNNASELQIADPNLYPNASLTLYLGGNFEAKNGGIVNNLSADPQKLKIYGLDTCTSMNFMSSSIFYGAIYAPNADVRIGNSVEFFGSVVADSFIQDVAANFHYDASLKEVSINEEGVRFVVKQWCEN